jgi:DNA-binding phage protein
VTPADKLGPILAREIASQQTTVYAVAKRAGVRADVIHDAIAGGRPRIDTLFKILGALGRDLRWLHEQGSSPTIQPTRPEQL